MTTALINRLRRFFCQHRGLRVRAATGAHLTDTRYELGVGNNVQVGVLVRCPDCRRTWTDEVVACAPREAMLYLRGTAITELPEEK